MKKTKSIRSVIHCILTVIVLIFAQNVSYAQIQTGSFVFDGHTRDYTVFLPQNYQPNMPVVLNLHGSDSPLQLYMDFLMMNELADTAGFIVVYPVGIDLAWNSWGDSNPPNIDDVGFISALIDTLYTQYNINMARIYCTGYSNGAMMTYRLAAELGHRFAAIAPIAGNLSDIAVNWNPIRPMPIINFHGTADTYVPYNGQGSDWSVVKTLNFWVQNNNCSLPADTILLPDIDPTDNSTVEKISWTNCTNNSSIIHYKIINGGHTWPGANPWPPGGATNNDINANVEMWNFFKNYENPLVIWAKTVEVFPEYLDPQGDTLFVKVHMFNPQNHSVSVYTKINGEGVSFSDSLLLYDDGMHFDENPNDNIWGNAKLLSGLEEDIYIVEIYTHDFSVGSIHKSSLPSYFTTIGPVVFEDYVITSNDTVPNPGDIMRFKLELRNNGLTGTAGNIKAVISTADSCISEITANRANYGDIPAGESVIPASDFQYYRVEIDPNCPGNKDIWFNVDIYSDNNYFWSDSFVFHIYGVTAIDDEKNSLPDKYILHQNYPNPFNPTTRIKFQIPEAGLVSLQVYNLLGEVVATLVNEEKSIGNYELEFDAADLTSGIYFYRLQVGSFVETKKMILLK